MELEEYRRIADAEDAHWWYRATRALMRQMLEPWLRPGIEVLDAGCGPGGNAAWLAEFGSVTGVDYMPEAVRLARERHPEIEVLQGDIAALPLEDDAFDIAIAITVVALVPDDAKALSELARVTKPGGAVLLLEPAMPALRREHDTVTMTRRRYRLDELEHRVEAAGLRVRRSTYAYSFLAPPALAIRGLQRLRPSAGENSSDLERDRLGRAFGAMAGAERRVIARRKVPFGLSAVVLAEKPPA